MVMFIYYLFVYDLTLKLEALLLRGYMLKLFDAFFW